MCVKNPTRDELRRTGDGNRIVKCHSPRRVTHHHVEREIAIVEIAPAFNRDREVAVGYCVREKSDAWAHQLRRKLTRWRSIALRVGGVPTQCFKQASRVAGTASPTGIGWRVLPVRGPLCRERAAGGQMAAKFGTVPGGDGAKTMQLARK